MALLQLICILLRKITQFFNQLLFLIHEELLLRRMSASCCGCRSIGSTHDNTAIAGVIPNSWIEWAVGGNSLLSNFFASFTGAFMYFATLTEVPIIQGLLASGMGKGPALALLLAGPSLSLPNMLVIRGVMGTKKTIVYVTLVIVMATVSGFIYGNLF